MSNKNHLTGGCAAAAATAAASLSGGTGTGTGGMTGCETNEARPAVSEVGES